MPNNAAWDTATTVPADRAAQAVSLNVAARALAVAPAPVTGGIVIPANRTIPTVARAGGGVIGNYTGAVPTAAPEFTLSAASNSISANITNPNGAESYEVRVDSGVTRIGRIASNLTASTSYDFQIRGVNEFGASAWSAIQTISTAAAGNAVASTPVERQFKHDVNAVGGLVGGTAQNDSGYIDGKPVFSDGAWGSTFSDEYQIDGQNVLRLSVNQGSTGRGLGGLVQPSIDGVFQLQKGDEFWVKTKIRFPSNSWQWNSGRNKFFRNLVKTAVGDNVGYIDLYIDGNQSLSEKQVWWIFEGNQSWTAPSDVVIFPDTNHVVEMYIKLDDVSGPNGGSAKQRVWVDGNLIIDGDKRTLNNADDYIFLHGLFYYYGNDTAPADLHIYAKDFIVQSELPSSFDANGYPFIGV